MFIAADPKIDRFCSGARPEIGRGLGSPHPPGYLKPYSHSPHLSSLHLTRELISPANMYDHQTWHLACRDSACCRH